MNDRANSVYGFLRYGHAPHERMLVACNFTPVPRHGYRMGVPEGGVWRECLNTDSSFYGGSGVGNLGAVEAEPVPAHGWPRSLNLTLPPLAVLWFEPGAPA